MAVLADGAGVLGDGADVAATAARRGLTHVWQLPARRPDVTRTAIATRTPGAEFPTLRGRLHVPCALARPVRLVPAASASVVARTTWACGALRTRTVTRV